MAFDLIVMYHSIIPDGVECSDWLHVPVSRFESQMRFFSRWFEPVSPDVFISDSHSIRPRLLVTFDDGYANNALIAYPVLKRLGIPALFFLSTDYLDEDWFWWDRLRMGMAAVGQSALSEHYEKVKRLKLGESIEASVSTILHDAKAPVKPDAVSWLRPLTWQEAKSFALQKDVYIGNHGHRHEIFSQLNASELDSVLGLSQALLAERLGVHANWGAPPNGEWLSDQIGHAQNAGLHYLVGTQQGWVKRGAGMTAMPRLGVGPRDNALSLSRRLVTMGVRQRFASQA